MKTAMYIFGQIIIGMMAAGIGLAMVIAVAMS